MRVLGYGILGIVSGVVLAAIFFFLIPATRFLFENDLLGLGPMFMNLGIVAIGVFGGIFWGIKKEIQKGRELDRSRFNIAIRCFLGILLLSIALGPVPLFNPILMVKLFAVDMPVEKFRSILKKKDVQRQVANNPSLSVDERGNTAGIGFAEDVHSLLVLKSGDLLISGQTATPFKMGSNVLGPVLKIHANDIDSVFTNNVLQSLKEQEGRRSSVSDSSRSDILLLGEFSNGNILLKHRSQFYFLVDKFGRLIPDTQALHDPHIGPAHFSLDRKFVYFGRSLVQYYNTSDKQKLSLIFRMDENGNFPEGDFFEVPKAESENIHDFFVFPSGKMAVINGFNDGYTSLIDNTGKIYTQEKALGYVPWSRILKLGNGNVAVVFRQQSEIPKMLELSDSGITPYDKSFENCSSLILENSLPLPAKKETLLTGSIKCGTRYAPIMKVKEDGTIDGDFLRNVETSTPDKFFFHTTGYQSKLSIDQQGNIYLSNSVGGLLRYQSDGSYDKNFVKYLESTIKGQSKNFALLPDSFILTGKFTAEENKTTYLNIAKISLAPMISSLFLQNQFK